MSRDAYTAKIIPQHPLEEISRIDDHAFRRDLDALIKDSERMRLKRMQQYRARSFIAMTFSILFVCAGAACFGWYFLMEANLTYGCAGLFASLFVVILLYIWAGKPVRSYKKEHKALFMPKLAKTLNGLSFYPNRGVSEKILKHLGVMPSYDRYEAEDCFMGKYKGVKVIFSEARLYSKRYADAPVFDGIFVLLETPQEVFEGHTIITADHTMVKENAGKRWNKHQNLSIKVSNPAWDRFEIFSTKPDSAELFVGDRLIKELAEAAEIFDRAALTAVLFKKKYVFMMIPYDKDMFEASELFVPITTHGQAMSCKKEIEQLLEIIDIFDLYQPFNAS